MKRTFLTLMCMASVAMLTACGGGNANKKTAEGKALGGDDDKAFAVKYENGYGTIYVFTIDGGQRRIDTYMEMSSWDQNDVETKYVNHEIDLSCNAEENPIRYEDKEWKESFMAAQNVGNFQIAIKDKSKAYMEMGGFTASGETKILGKTCKVFSGNIKYLETEKGMRVAGYDVFDSNKDKKGEFAVWNGLVMRIVVNGKTELEAVGFTNDVPTSAFTKTTDVNWIK